MIFGKSNFHVSQNEGSQYSFSEIKGYFNNLSGKVNENTILDECGIPFNKTASGITAYYPITVFQYGLGNYELYLTNHDKKYYEQFMRTCDWAIENIDSNGCWKCMSRLNDTKHETQSSMCQGEGCSLLLRAFIETKNEKYLDCAKKAVDFMLKSTSDGGTASYDDGGIVFQEYVSDANLCVLNGWIFSLFGLIDYCIISGDKNYYDKLKLSVDTLAKKISSYDTGYWSYYDVKGTIASKAYHLLHIELLKVIYKYSNQLIFKTYIDKFEHYSKKKRYERKAFFAKAFQKLKKNKLYDLSTTLVE